MLRRGYIFREDRGRKGAVLLGVHDMLGGVVIQGKIHDYEFASEFHGSSVLCRSPLSTLRRQKCLKIELTNVPRERSRQGAFHRGSSGPLLAMSDRGDPSRVDRQGLKTQTMQEPPVVSCCVPQAQPDARGETARALDRATARSGEDRA